MKLLFIICLFVSGVIVGMNMEPKSHYKRETQNIIIGLICATCMGLTLYKNKNL